MKRYPFSKKAVQAIVAASLVFTPAAGFVSSVQAQTVETENTVTAAAYNVSDLVTKLNRVYAALNRNANKEELQKMKVMQAKVESMDWKPYAKRLLIKDDAAKVNAMAVLLKDIAAFGASTTIGELQKGLDKLKNDSAVVTTILGENVSSQDVQNLIIAAAIEYYNQLEKLKADATEAELNAALKNAVKSVYNSDVKGDQAKYAKILAAIYSNIKLAEVESVLADIAAEADPKADARKALLRTLKKVDQGTPGGGGGGGGSSDPDPVTVDPTPYNPGAGEAKVPANAVVSEKVVANGQTQYVTTVSAQKADELAGLISTSTPVLVLPLPQAATGEINKAIIPGTFFTKAAAKNANAALLVKTAEAGYKLPVQAINLAELAQQFGVSADEVQIEITVTIVPKQDVQGAINKNKLNPVSNVIEFTVKAKAGNHEKLISTFKTFVEREIIADKELDPKLTAGLRINKDGTVSPVPTKITGKTGTIKSTTNSNYVLVENNKTFADIDNGANYFEEHIEKLASKYIINGKTETSYAPSANITRGEFAALISRSLGLVAKNLNEGKFSDVSLNQAVNKNGEIYAAVEAGIIQGFPNGTFKPNQPITRAEAAIMIDRAMKFTNVPASKFDSAKKITTFKDAASIGVSSRDSIEKVVQANIMNGFGNGEFGAYQHMKRDQMAKVLDKFLQVSDLIN